MLTRGREINADVANLELVHNTAPDLRVLGERRFDLVYSSIVLQHQPSHAIARGYVDEMVRLLAPGGWLVFQIPLDIPRRYRLRVTRRAYTALRALGVSPHTLYERLKLHPISMLFVPEAELRSWLGAVRVAAIDHAAERPDPERHGLRDGSLSARAPRSTRHPSLTGAGRRRSGALAIVRRRLPEHGWEVDVVSAPEHESAVELPLATARRTAASARHGTPGPRSRTRRSRCGRAARRVPALDGVGAARGACAAGAPAGAAYDAVLATGPPMVALLAARARRCAADVRRSSSSCATCGPAARRSIAAARSCRRSSDASFAARARDRRDAPRRRSRTSARGTPAAAERIVEIPNGFEPELLDGAATTPPRRPAADDPALRHAHRRSPAGAAARRDRPATIAFRLVLHGYVAPAIAGVAARGSAWRSNVLRRSLGGRRRADAAADVALITQARGAGDATAVASKVVRVPRARAAGAVRDRRRRDRGAAAALGRRRALRAARTKRRASARRSSGSPPATAAAGARRAARAVRAARRPPSAPPRCSTRSVGRGAPSTARATA